MTPEGTNKIVAAIDRNTEVWNTRWLVQTPHGYLFVRTSLVHSPGASPLKDCLVCAWTDQDDGRMGERTIPYFEVGHVNCYMYLARTVQTLANELFGIRR